ncbi:hypothetical protein THMIRHAM_08020 [Thiomicrorhabdus immobilis]|uniref:Flagellar hook-length control protein-like C-terminal domain-containing protein n=2 Tax=Thiomicrorhabdus immobilis TaxID=2791037 RepID=A0ABM7MC99_9GAMM|nr:hypothetical protein THMIRHAM_08020 [Thiomicrorhabdus immobilis]
MEQVTKRNQGLNADNIKQKLNDSGLFLESKLATQARNQTPQNFKNDLKNQILQLQQQVTDLQQQNPSNSLNKLSHLLNQALSRLTVQQVQLFENPTITPLEIPYETTKDNIKDYIEFRKVNQNDKNQWEAYIDSTLTEGLLSVKLRLSDNGTLDCYLWCETAPLQNKVEQQLGSLQELLDRTGLKLNNIQISSQKPVKTDTSTKMALIDIKI